MELPCLFITIEAALFKSLLCDYLNGSAMPLRSNKRGRHRIALDLTGFENKIREARLAYEDAVSMLFGRDSRTADITTNGIKAR